jgi:RNAse (barnase) inhibitor barstar
VKDEIIAEVWRNKDRLAAKYGHNLDALVAAIQARERRPLTVIAKKRCGRRAPARQPR